MSAYADSVVSHLLAQTWQIALLAGIVGLISAALRNRSAHLRYLLWLVVLAKCLVPPVLTIPLAVLPERSAIPSVALMDVPEEPSAPEMSVPARDIAQPQAWEPTLPGTREAIALGWMAGVFLFLLWVGGRAVRYTTWLRARRKPLPPELEKSIQDLSLGFRFRTWPRIWLLDEIGQPFVWGLLRGSVYLPAHFLSLKSGTGVPPVKNKQGQDGPATHGQDAHATADRQRNILAHELSHVARWDAGVNLLQVLAQAVYWFHPLVWWANRRIRQEREKCCDEMAVAHLHTPPEHYTGAIVDILSAERWSARPIPSLAIVGSVRDIEERIKTMLRPGKTFQRRPSLPAATVVLLVALVTLPTALVLTARGQTRPPTQTTDQPAAGTEKTEQPRYAPRTFNSEMAFDVFVRTHENMIVPRPIGKTPSAAPLEIPACRCWVVQPLASVPDWDLLIREMHEKKIPGLRLKVATDSDLNHLTGLTELQHLDLTRTKVTDAGLEHLRGLSGLRELSLWGTSIAGAGLVHLKGLTGLQELWLDNTQVTDAGMAHVEGLTGLKVLRVDGSKITDAGLQHIRGLSELRELSLRNTKITDAGMAHLKGLTQLQGLLLHDTQITDAGLSYLQGLTGLYLLWLDGTQVTDAGLLHLRDLTGLLALSLNNTRVTDVGLAHLKGLTKLDTLVLSGQITDAGVQQLKQSLPNVTVLGRVLPVSQRVDKPAPLTTGAAADNEKMEQLRFAARTFNAKTAFRVYLREPSFASRTIGFTPADAPLRIPACDMWHVTPSAPVKDWNLLVQEIKQNGVPGLMLRSASDAKMQHLATLTGLQDLDLDQRDDSGVTDTGLAYLKGLSGLQSLRLRWTPITDAGLQHLKNLTGLQELYLRNTKITGVGLEHLKELPRLQLLDLTNTQITDAGLAHLGSLDALRHLTLSNTQITDAGLAHLAGLRGLRTLSLLDTQVTDAGLVHLRSLTTLEELNLQSTRTTDTGLGDLRALSSLRSLWLSGSQITDTGMEHLKALTKLQQLGVHGITDAGLRHLRGLTTLEGLSLTGSARITDAGLEYLKGVTGLQRLRLYLTGAQVTDAGIEHLKSLTGCQLLELSTTQVTDVGLAHLKGLVGLQNLGLSRTNLTEAGLEHLKGLTELRQLQLSWTRIGDPGLDHLKGLSNLQYLILNRTQVTDAGLAHLKGMSGLRRLDLFDAPVTDAGVEQLERSLPNLVINR